MRLMNSKIKKNYVDDVYILNNFLPNQAYKAWIMTKSQPWVNYLLHGPNGCNNTKSCFFFRYVSTINSLLQTHFYSFWVYLDTTNKNVNYFTTYLPRKIVLYHSYDILKCWKKCKSSNWFIKAQAWAKYELRPKGEWILTQFQFCAHNTGSRMTVICDPAMFVVCTIHGKRKWPSLWSASLGSSWFHNITEEMGWERCECLQENPKFQKIKWSDI